MKNKYNWITMWLIIVGQISAHYGDFLYNDFKNIGVIVMLAILAHLLNGILIK